jgi:hypothetical protein
MVVAVGNDSKPNEDQPRGLSAGSHADKAPNDFEAAPSDDIWLFALLWKTTTNYGVSEVQLQKRSERH